jgi:two-component system, NarL family, invasion response regulator UvrY
MKKIVLCDDHSIIRRGLKYLVTSHFYDYTIDEFNSIAETLTYLKKNTPSFAIFDLQLSDGNMIEALPNITTLYPKMDILIYSMSNEIIYGKRVLQMGAKGFLNKDADEEEVLRALQMFLSGENYISRSLNNLLINDLRKTKTKTKTNENPFTSLSNREVEVTHHLLFGKGVKEISNKMNLHANTIVTYKNRVFEKLSIHNIIDLTNLAKLYNFV